MVGKVYFLVKVMNMTSFLTEEELLEIGFKSVGIGVLISRKASIYGASRISIGNNVRVDDYCILSGNIELGNYIHIAAYSAIFGGNEGVIMEDFSGLSSRVSIYAASDDYSGFAMTNPTVPEEYTHVIEKQVIIKKHAIIGATSLILPGSIVAEGVACGGFTMVKGELEPWSIYIGAPAHKIKDRSKNLLEMEAKMMLECANNENVE